jgi:hypothetical protein
MASIRRIYGYHQFLAKNNSLVPVRLAVPIALFQIFRWRTFHSQHGPQVLYFRVATSLYGLLHALNLFLLALMILIIDILVMNSNAFSIALQHIFSDT